MASVAIASLILLLVAFEPVIGAWTTAQPLFSATGMRLCASRLDLVAEESPEPSKNLSATEHCASSLSRREALSKGIFGTGIVSVLSFPASPLTGTAAAQGIQPPSSSASSAATSLLSNYQPNKYKTLPSYGRTVFPPPFLPPLDNRATYRYSLGRDAWALEQLLAFANVTATIRTNVIKMEDGGLWVCGPLWPTDEYCALLDELGPVKHVVLPTNALEHKAAMKQFSLKYPDADVWISPGQYGPFGECGIITDDMDENQVAAVVKKAAKTMGYRVDGIFPVRADTEAQSKIEEMKPEMYPPWKDAFDIETLCVELPGNAGPVSESAFVHKSSKTLVVTDAVICVPSVSTAPTTANDPTKQFPIQPIFSTYFDESTISDITFWPRTVLQAVFLPLRAESSKSGSVVYPGFEALTNRLVRAPILRAFVDARAPNAVRDWVIRISDLTTFDRICSAHFASPINAGPDLFKKAFSHLSQEDGPPDGIACEDWATLNSLNDFIDDNKLGAPVVYNFRKGCV